MGVDLSQVSIEILDRALEIIEERERRKDAEAKQNDTRQNNKIDHR